MQYTVIFVSRVDAQLLKYVEFWARVSIPAAKAFRTEFAEILAQLEDNPFLFPPETDPNLPAGLYRKALFAKRYKVLFSVDDATVYLDAVIECRQDTKERYAQFN